MTYLEEMTARGMMRSKRLDVWLDYRPGLLGLSYDEFKQRHAAELQQPGVSRRDVDAVAQAIPVGTKVTFMKRVGLVIAATVEGFWSWDGAADDVRVLYRLSHSIVFVPPVPIRKRDLGANLSVPERWAQRLETVTVYGTLGITTNG